MLERKQDGDSYTPVQAAHILRVTPTRIRQLLQGGELEGERDEAGHWRIPSRAVDEQLERVRRDLFPEGVWADLSLSEWVEKVENLQRELGCLEGHLDLGERSESNLLDERDQLLKERDEAASEVRRLKAELKAVAPPRALLTRGSDVAGAEWGPYGTLGLSTETAQGKR